MQHIHHFRVGAVVGFVYFQHLLVLLACARLVKHAQHLFKPIVHPPAQQRNLHYYAVMRQTLHKLTVNAAYLAPVIITHLVAHIHHRLVYVAHTMPQQIHGHHWIGIAFL